MAHLPIALALVALFLGSRAEAFTTVSPTGAVNTVVGAGNVRLVDGAGQTLSYVGRNFAGTPGQNTIGIVESYAGRIGGNQIAVNASRTLLFAEVAAAAAALGGAAWVGVQAGGIISHALGNDEVMLGDVRCVASTTGWQCDDGGESETVQLWRAGGIEPYGFGTNASQACADYAAKNTTTCSASVNGISWSLSYPGSGSYCTGTKTISYAGPCTAAAPAQEIVFVGLNGTQQQCPGFIDALNPAYSKADGEASPGSDGKCPTGRYNETPPAEVAQRLAARGNPASLPTLAPEVLAKGQPITTASPRAVTGPDSVPGIPTVSVRTLPNGTTITTTVQPRTVYTYDGDTVSHREETTTTTETCSGGVCDTVTDETEGPTESETEDPCEANPDRLGCVRMGEPDDTSPEWEEKQVDYEAVDLGLGSSCPAPQTVSLANFDLVVDWVPVCDLAPAIRLAMIAMSAFGALFWVVAAVARS